MDFKLLLKRLDLGMIVIQAVAQVLLHVLDLLIWREEREKVIDFELRFLEDVQSFRYLVFRCSDSTKHLLGCCLVLFLALIVEKVFGNLHPKLLFDLLILWLIRVLFGHVHISTLKSNFDSFIKMVENCINYDLGFLLDQNLLSELLDFTLSISLGSPLTL